MSSWIGEIRSQTCYRDESLLIWTLGCYTKSLWVCTCFRFQTPKAHLRSLAVSHDIHVEVPRVVYEKLSGDRMWETSETIRKCVQATRNIQHQRFASLQSDIVCNADMRVGKVGNFTSCRLKVKI